MNLPDLPHAYPFLMLDRVVDLEPGRSIVATKNLTSTDPLLQPNGVLPAIFLVEALTQAAGLALAAAGGQGQPQPGVLARIDRFRTRGRLTAGDRLTISVRIVRTFGPTALARGVVTVGGRRCAAAEIAVRLGNPTSPAAVSEPA
ncbi:hydroxymyristoyl-ACP dehydratase [Candidatus Binatia bacterium]|nr:hydroxymyristoyl-ACP dehydratase [Candidatus Binatia bacterium]